MALYSCLTFLNERMNEIDFVSFLFHSVEEREVEIEASGSAGLVFYGQ